jgi:methionyl-tRNA formyltransferase
MMKLAFFGTPGFAVPCLEKLIHSGHEIKAVITQPDRPAGRKQEVLPTPVKLLAQKHSLHVMQPEKIKSPEFLKEYEKLDLDLNIIIAFGQILPDELIYHPKYHSINIHASLLPRYRGASPINWALINGDTHTGISYQFIVQKLDAGDIIYTERIRIKDTDTYITVHDRLSRLTADTVLKVIESIENNTYTRVKQDESLSTYVTLLKKDDGKINFNLPSEKISRKIRGLLPWPAAFCGLDDKTLKIFSAEPYDCVPTGTAGMISDVIKGRGFVVEVYGSCLLVTEVQYAGAKRMNAYQFSLGYKDLKGKILK